MVAAHSRFWGLLPALALLGCAHDLRWGDFWREPGYGVPRNVPVVVSWSEDVRVHPHDYDGFVERALWVARADLLRRGIELAIVDAHQVRKPLPRVQLSLLEWNPPRSYTAFVAGIGKMPGHLQSFHESANAVIEIEAFSPAGKLMLQAQFFAKYEEDYVDGAAAAAGHAFAKELAGGESAPLPDRARSSGLFTGDPYQ